MALVFNHPSFLPHQESIRREVVEEKARSTNLLRTRAGARLDYRNRVATLDGYASRNYFQELLAYPYAQAPRLLRSMRLSVHQPPDGETFVVGDYPVVSFRHDLDGNRRLPRLSQMIVLPVGHSCLLIYDSSAPNNIIDHGEPISTDLLRSLDEIYRGELGCRYVYGRTKESLARAL